MWRLCVLFTFELCTMILGGGKDIMLNFTNDLRIFNNSLQFLIKSSFPSSRCCNIHIYGQSIGIDFLFNEFIENYEHDYTILNTTYACEGYFLISSTPDAITNEIKRVIPTSIATTELLIIIDDELPNNSTLFNETIFQNSNVNILARSGIWKLSGNYESPRKFMKITSLSELGPTRGLINLDGRKLQVAAFYYPPFCYLKTSVNRTVNGVEGQFFVANNEKEVDGVEVKLLLMMAEKLNFTWEIRKPDRNYQYGRPNGTNWNGGLIGQIFRREVDFAFSSILLKYDHYRYINLSTPWYDLAIAFLVPRPKARASIWALGKPFSQLVWCAIFCMIGLQSIVIFAKAKINPNVQQEFRSYIFGLTELIGRLVGTSSPREAKGLRFQLHLWHITGLLLVTAFCSSLDSILTSPEFDPRIDTFEQFLKANLTWGREGQTPIFNDYFNLKDKYAKQMPSKFNSDLSVEHRHQKILKGNYAIIGRIIRWMFFPEKNISSTDLENYRVMKQTSAKYYISFAVAPWLVESINKLTLWLKECGFVKYHFVNVVNRRSGSALRKILIEHDEKNEDGARVLILKPLLAGFGFLFFGLFVSTIVFCFEMKSKNQLKPFMVILQEVKIRKMMKGAKGISRREKERKKNRKDMIESWKSNNFRNK